MAWDWWDWEIALTSAIAAAALAQVVVAALLWRLHRRQEDLEQPLLELFWNGFQSQPHDKDEMLFFMVTIANKGRRSGRLTNWGMEIVDGGGKADQASISFTSMEGKPMDPLKAYGEAVNLGWETAPRYADDGRVIPPFSVMRVLVWLPGGAGWHEWQKARLFFEPVGGPRAGLDIDWNLFWLKHR